MTDGYKEISIKTAEPKTVMVEVEDISSEPVFQEELEVDVSSGEQKRTLSKEPSKRGKNVEVTFGEDEIPGEVDKWGKSLNEELEQPPQEKPIAEPKVKAKQREPGRAEKRIRELNGKNNNLEQELAMERAKRFELEQKLQTGNKSTQEVLKVNLAEQVSLLNNQIVEAIKNAEADKIVDLQDKLWNAKANLAAVSADLAKPEVKQEAPRQQQQQAPIPEKALEWIDAHPEFKTDEDFYLLSMNVSNRLVQEGFSPETDEYYEELDARLSKRFPELFGIADGNSVQYREEDENPLPSSRKQEDVKTKQPVRTTVSGASRTPSPTASARKQSNTVKLSPADIDQAERWGWSLERMARRKLHIEKNRREDGYVPIVMPSDRTR